MIFKSLFHTLTSKIIHGRLIFAPIACRNFCGFLLAINIL